MTQREIKPKKDEWYKWKPLLTSREMPSQSLSSSPWPTFPLVLLVSVTPRGVEHPLGQLGSAVPAGSPPNSLCSPASSGGVGQGAEKALVLCKHHSAVTKTSLNYQHYSQIQNMASYQLLWRKLTLSHSKLAQKANLKATGFRVCREKPFTYRRARIPKLFLNQFWMQFTHEIWAEHTKITYKIA